MDAATSQTPNHEKTATPRGKELVMDKKPQLKLMLCLCTEYGPVGPRLARGRDLPITSPYFEDSEEGRKQAIEATEKMQDYFKRHWKEK